mmetsp:Transcript_7841/g.28428  ORF Transcript_7841/g.28428 Transcript_7841/m.28428 type:complete len:212 (+) Transcript_7841:311-946(+)
MELASPSIVVVRSLVVLVFSYAPEVGEDGLLGVLRHVPNVVVLRRLRVRGVDHHDLPVRLVIIDQAESAQDFSHVGVPDVGHRPGGNVQCIDGVIVPHDARHRVGLLRVLPSLRDGAVRERVRAVRHVPRPFVKRVSGGVRHGLAVVLHGVVLELLDDLQLADRAPSDLRHEVHEQAGLVGVGGQVPVLHGRCVRVGRDVVPVRGRCPVDL